MKLIEEVRSRSDDSLVAVLTGNGRTELQILKILTEKHNGNDVILFLPRPPFHFRPITGLSALKAVKTYRDKYEVTRTLFLVDREHLRTERIDNEIGDVLRSFGVDVQGIVLSKKLWENVLIVRGLVGTREITIYIAVIGERSCIEEDIAKLVELELKTKVEPNKRAIHCALHNHSINKYALVRKARIGSLRKAFPGLNLVLERIKKDNIKR